MKSVTLVKTLIQRISFTRRQRRRGLLLSVPALSLLVLGFFLFERPAIADLSEEHRHYLPTLLEEWEEGDVVVLLRHLERCDKEDFPCLEGTSGITARSVPLGKALNEDYFKLGLSRTDVFNSPLTRTAQTEELVFGDLGEDQDWLYQCRESMLEDALRTKQPGRNLVLVTHSSCIARFEKALGYDSETPAYDTSLFFNQVADDRLQVLGYLDTDDWDASLDY